ncbi:hypothetical protein [uncultured Paraglaciecola sp.]|uniref:hypothetical protein n=1 Tax=uncultured Paraglaciecola sp. TaxID=1765024 RepID=UPI00260A748F|nr:hypothetical protein [uncultured Paraglaciecola sp.]
MKTKHNNVQSEHISDSKLMQAGFAQCVFIAIQTLVFPELGFLGCIIAAQCALFPWLLPICRQAVVTAVAMSLTSIVISPLFYLVCLHTMDSIKELISPTVNQLTLHFVDILKTYLRVTHD